MSLDPYASGVLTREEHGRLVANLDAYARDANIQPRWVWTKMADVCGEAEMEYARAFNRHRAEGKVWGLCYTRGTPDADPDEHMASMAGALVRNFCRARVMTLGRILNLLASREEVVATALADPQLLPQQGRGRRHRQGPKPCAVRSPDRAGAGRPADHHLRHQPRWFIKGLRDRLRADRRVALPLDWYLNPVSARESLTLHTTSAFLTRPDGSCAPLDERALPAKVEASNRAAPLMQLIA